MLNSILTRQQKQLVRSVKAISAKKADYAGLRRCKKKRCGKMKCRPWCAFRMERDHRENISRAQHLFCAPSQTVYEVRLIRASWVRPFGELHGTSIGAAQKLARRALNRILSDVSAVGAIKLSPQIDGLWVCEAHLLVTGADKQIIEGCWGSPKYSALFGDFAEVAPVKDLEKALSDVFDLRLRAWKHPFNIQDQIVLSDALHQEHVAWQLKCHPSGRIFRYGVDRHFNKLKKAPRVPPPKKKRRTPYWLQPYQFGSHNQLCECKRCRILETGP